MSKEKNKIIENTVNYLKFYKEHYNYTIYKNEINFSNSPPGLFEAKEPGHDKVTGKIISKPEAAKDKEIIVKDSVNESVMPLIKEDWMDCDTLEAFANAIKDCPKCSLLVRTRRQVVFGSGNPNAEVVVVGEAPGADEDEKGKPFVGRAGKLLTEILKAINFSREEVFICNILKCRPPENRNPLPDEIANCEPYLFKQLEMIKPKLILAVGTFAAQTLLGTKEPLGRLRGKFHTYKGIKMMVTYHPAALLRNPNWKKPTWEDVKLFRKEYDKQLTVSS
ncbi:MAG: uracil-DNA glycosylase [Bacteroidota bacterium]|nr:uracil-DNA glycosylase [Bacteroidota bacterium]